MVTKIQLEDLKQAFLANGGTFLRKATSPDGEPIIEHCNAMKFGVYNCSYS